MEMSKSIWLFCMVFCLGFAAGTVARHLTGVPRSQEKFGWLDWTIFGSSIVLVAWVIWLAYQ